MRRCVAFGPTAAFIGVVLLSRGGVRWCNTNNRPQYSSTTAFKLRPCEVDEMNVPSAREVAAMIPSRAELQRQLPTARELEAQFVAGGGVIAAPMQPPLWPDCDTPEDIIDEERSGSAGENCPPPLLSPHHVLLAWRALMWGTLYAVVGVAAVVLAAMYMCGMRSAGDILARLRGRVERERSLLEAGGRDVTYIVLDLTNPATLVQQVQEMWRVIEELAAAEESSGSDLYR